MTGRSLQAQRRPTRHPALGQDTACVVGFSRVAHVFSIKLCNDGRRSLARLTRYDVAMKADGFASLPQYGSQRTAINRVTNDRLGPICGFFADEGTSG